MVLLVLLTEGSTKLDCPLPEEKTVWTYSIIVFLMIMWVQYIRYLTILCGIPKKKEGKKAFKHFYTWPRCASCTYEPIFQTSLFQTLWMMVRRKKIQSKGPSMPKENGKHCLTIARGEIENYKGSVKLKRKSNFGYNHEEKQWSISEYLYHTKLWKIKRRGKCIIRIERKTPVTRAHMRRLELKRVEWTRPVTMVNISYKGTNLHPDKENMFLFFFTSTCHNGKVLQPDETNIFCSLVLWKICSVNQQLWNCHWPGLSRDLNTPINQSFYVMRGYTKFSWKKYFPCIFLRPSM